MIERPLMTPDELKSLPKGTFVVMKTGFYPMKVKLKLFFDWGIHFEKPYEVIENSNRKVHYANRLELLNNIIETYCPQLLEEPQSDAQFEEGSTKKKQNESLKTSPADSKEEEHDESTEVPDESTEQPPKESKKKNAALKTEPPKGSA